MADLPGRDGPFIPPEDLPEVVRHYLARRHVVTLSVEQYRELYDKAFDPGDGCRFPEHRHFKFGNVTHMRYLGPVSTEQPDGMFYLEGCEVCGTVQMRESVPLAAS